MPSRCGDLKSACLLRHQVPIMVLQNFFDSAFDASVGLAAATCFRLVLGNYAARSQHQQFSFSAIVLLLSTKILPEKNCDLGACVINWYHWLQVSVQSPLMVRPKKDFVLVRLLNSGRSSSRTFEQRYRCWSVIAIVIEPKSCPYVALTSAQKCSPLPQGWEAQLLLLPASHSIPIRWLSCL